MYAAYDCLAIHQLFISTDILKHGQRSLNLSSQATTQSTNQTLTDEEPEQNEPLSKEERKKIHNRTCTLKQRRHYYRCEIIRRNIDRRFSICEIKNILRQNNILFYVINISTSSINHNKTLYIGIRDESKLEEYQIKTKTLFTTDHYNQLKYERREARSSSKDDRNVNRRDYHTK
ncbi:unnamed protein product [Rotaria sp. Silwood2]|nr:unnamed protein product [Rotaria sp. Silwood2]CAF3230756.1 unnamed protein product [Rotaria sp. Silwood2]CAF3385818.1 unnamed protein product [Rotaria sp. Silwood2]CAF3481838.1 unnamed protein product [Rotaria sp. Silwood2]CAF4439883.1 unnamed protein product [Rotaria sp. Silwood2]